SQPGTPEDDRQVVCQGRYDFAELGEDQHLLLPFGQLLAVSPRRRNLPLSAGLLPWRRSEAVTMAGRARNTAASSTAGEG
ncbi:hypothetical protein, partial [Klebsiella variicola]|uniref:hypothetical protein n=1 Tax=Klebsiella variicola TaxID=244366 RepID=UPI002731DC8D